MFEKPKNQPEEIKPKAPEKLEKTPNQPASPLDSSLTHYYLTLPVKLEDGSKYLEKLEVWAKSNEELWELVIDKLAEAYGDKKVDADFNKAVIHILESENKPKESLVKRSEPVEYAFETKKEDEGRYLVNIRFIVKDAKKAKEEYRQFQAYGKTKAEAEQRALEELYKKYPGAEVTQIYINAFDNPIATPQELESFPLKVRTKEQFEKEKKDIERKIIAKHKAIKKAIERKEEMKKNQKEINFRRRGKERK